MGRAVRVHLRIIEKITGHRPPTCPWRVFYEELVHEVIALTPFAPDGNLSAALGPDPAAVLVDAWGVYESAKRRTVAEDEKLARQKIERDRKAAEARGRRR
jgi:hypothetical protein